MKKLEREKRKANAGRIAAIEENPDEAIRVSLPFNPEFYPEFREAIVALEHALIEKKLVRSLTLP